MASVESDRAVYGEAQGSMFTVRARWREGLNHREDRRENSHDSPT